MNKKKFLSEKLRTFATQDKLNKLKNEWLSTKEAAEYLSMTPNAIRIWVCRGRLKAHKLGSRLRFRSRDLKIFILNGGR